MQLKATINYFVHIYLQYIYVLILMNINAEIEMELPFNCFSKKFIA